MKIAVSNIAWNPADDRDVASMLVSTGVTGLEIAPTMIWPDPLAVDEAGAAGVRRTWVDRGLPIVSFQALLYGRSDLLLFDTPEAREATATYLEGIIDLARAVGAGPLVFGSPGNRRRGDLSEAEADDISIDLFRRVGESASAAGCTLCLEPNPPQYRCDYITNVSSGRSLVERVAHPGFRLHLDTGAMTLVGDDIAGELQAAAPSLSHFHISEPDLAAVGPGSVDHDSFAAALRDIGYEGWCSLEMRNPGDLDVLARSVEYAVAVYG